MVQATDFAGLERIRATSRQVIMLVSTRVILMMDCACSRPVSYLFGGTPTSHPLVLLPGAVVGTNHADDAVSNSLDAAP